MRLSKSWLSVLTVAFFIPALLAQEGSGVARALSHPVFDRSQSDAIEADRQQRAELAEQIVADKESPGREFSGAFRAALIDRLKVETVEQLQARGRLGNISTNTLGDTRADLTYTTFQQPCRIIDTRVAGGALSGGLLRGFKVAGTAGFDLQGGTVGGCGVPVGATTVMINFVAVAPDALGNLKGSAYPNAIPTTGSIINYQALTPTLNIANGLLFPICDPTIATCSADITLQANGGGTHVVADVLGYAMQFDKKQVRSFTVQSPSTPGLMIGATCSVIASVTVVAPVDGKVLLLGKLVPSWGHTTGATSEVDLYVGETSGDCTGTFGLGHDFAAVAASLPSGNYFPMITVFSSLDAIAGTHVYDLSAIRVIGTDGTTVNTAGIVATFMPN